VYVQTLYLKGFENGFKSCEVTEESKPMRSTLVKVSKTERKLQNDCQWIVKIIFEVFKLISWKIKLEDFAYILNVDDCELSLHNVSQATLKVHWWIIVRPAKAFTVKPAELSFPSKIEERLG